MLTLNTSSLLKTLTLTTMLALSVTAQTVMAADAVKADSDFIKLDANKDGKISLKEAVKDVGLSVNFDAVDANKDGSITEDELTAFKLASVGKSTVTNPATTN